MARYVDALLIVYFCYAIIRGYKSGYFRGFFSLAGTVLAWAIAYLYTPLLSSKVWEITPQTVTHTLQRQLTNAWQITVSTGGYGLESDLPSNFVDCLRHHLALYRINGSQLIDLIQKIMNNFLVNLFCFACILIIVKMILAGITSIFANKKINLVTRHSGWGLVLGLIDAGFSVLLLCGVLMPFIIIFDHIGLAVILRQSRIVYFFSELFFYLLADWFLLPK